MGKYMTIMFISKIITIISGFGIIILLLKKYKEYQQYRKQNIETGEIEEKTKEQEDTANK